VLGPQASSPARLEQDQLSFMRGPGGCSWFCTTGAGEDACGPSTIAIDYFDNVKGADLFGDRRLLIFN
jgi:hypothetical protein